MEINNLYYKMTKNPRILIVDDSATNNLLIQSILADQGYDAVIATNGKEALKYIYEEKFDLILLDIMMPKMNGFEVLEKLNDDSEKMRIPVIVITAKVETKDVKKAIELGAVDYIKKPIDIDEIISRANMALRLKSVSDESRNVKMINNKLINILIKGFLNNHVNTFISGNINKGNFLNTIDSLIGTEINENFMFDQYNFEYSDVNIVDLIDRVFSVFVDKIKKEEITVEKNYSGTLLSKSDSSLLFYCLMILFNELFNNSKSKVVVSIYNSSNSNIIKIYNDSNNDNSIENINLISKLTSMFKLLNIQFNNTETSVSGKEYEIIIA